jgi:hypothetical protein
VRSCRSCRPLKPAIVRSRRLHGGGNIRASGSSNRCTRSYFQFDGRQGRSDVVEKRPDLIVAAVSDAYQADSLELRSYRKVEPVIVHRYDPGVELVVSKVRIDRDSIRLALAPVAGGAADEDPVTSLTIKWPVPLSKGFTEQSVVETLILGFLDYTHQP